MTRQHHYEHCRERLAPFFQSLRAVREGYRLLRQIGIEGPDARPVSLTTVVDWSVWAQPRAEALLDRVRRGDRVALNELNSALFGPQPMWVTLVEIGSQLEDLVLATAQLDSAALALVLVRPDAMDECLPSTGRSPEKTLAAVERRLATLQLELVEVLAHKHRRSKLRRYWEQRREEAQRDFDRATQAMAEQIHGGVRPASSMIVSDDDDDWSDDFWPPPVRA